MIDVTIYLFVLSIAAVTLFLTVWKDSEISNLFGVTCAFMLIFVGVMLGTDGIGYASGYSENQSVNNTYKEINFTHYDSPANFGDKESYWFLNSSSTTKNVINTYTTFKNDYTNGLSVFFILSGVILLVALSYRFVTQHKVEDEILSE